MHDHNLNQVMILIATAALERVHLYWSKLAEPLVPGCSWYGCISLHSSFKIGKVGRQEAVEGSSKSGRREELQVR